MHDAPPLESGGKRARRRTLLKKKERQGPYIILMFARPYSSSTAMPQGIEGLRNPG
jgi:hypothetical protein